MESECRQWVLWWGSRLTNHIPSCNHFTVISWIVKTLLRFQLNSKSLQLRETCSLWKKILCSIPVLKWLRWSLLASYVFFYLANPLTLSALYLCALQELFQPLRDEDNIGMDRLRSFITFDSLYCPLLLSFFLFISIACTFTAMFMVFVRYWEAHEAKSWIVSSQLKKGYWLGFNSFLSNHKWDQQVRISRWQLKSCPVPGVLSCWLSF